MQKKCSKCGQVKLATAFDRNAAQRDGLATYCKVCKGPYDAARRRGEPATLKKAQLEARRTRTEKACSKCGQVKPLAAYPRSKKAVDGRMGRCGACVAVYQAANKERIAKQQRRYREANREMICARDRKKREALSEAKREAKRLYLVEWRRRNRSRVRAYFHNYEARKKANGGSHTSAEWEALCEQYGHLCLSCGERKPLTEDHVLPVSQGGRDDISNIQPLCRPCNQSKGAKHIDYRNR